MCFSCTPASSAIELAKRAFLQESNSAATREQKTLKRKKQQCFRADVDPDVHISQAEAKVYAPRGSYVWNVKIACIGRLLPAEEGQNCAMERERDHVVFAQTTHKQLVSGRATHSRPLILLADATL